MTSTGQQPAAQADNAQTTQPVCWACENPCTEDDLLWIHGETGERGYICPDCMQVAVGHANLYEEITGDTPAAPLTAAG